MTVAELITTLQAMPQDWAVCIFDHRKNLADDYGEGSSVGVYPRFEIGQMTGDDIKEGTDSWIAIGFTNPDYDDEGRSFLNAND